MKANGVPVYVRNTETYVVRNIREIKIHAYRRRQTSDLSWEFLRIEKNQIKTVPNDSYGKINFPK